MYKYSVAIGLVSAPLPIILTSILPNLLAIAILHSLHELACVNSPIAKSYWSVVLSHIVVHHITRNS